MADLTTKMVEALTPRPKPSQRSFLGHRGSPQWENTIHGIRHALDVGLDGVEIDLQLSADGQVVVFHDDDFVRLAGRKLRLSELSLREIIHIPLHGGGRVPTLEDVLAIWPEDAWLNLELKAGGEKLVVATMDCIRKFPNLSNTACERIVFSSFDPNMLATAVASKSREIQAASYALLLHALSPAWMHHDGGAQLGADWVHLPNALCSRSRVEMYLSRGFGVGAWGAPTIAREEELLKMGVQRIITDLIENRSDLME